MNQAMSIDMKTQEQTNLTTYSKRIYSGGEPGATASLEILKDETRAWHRIYCAENSCPEISARRWVQIEDELERTGTTIFLSMPRPATSS